MDGNHERWEMKIARIYYQNDCGDGVVIDHLWDEMVWLSRCIDAGSICIEVCAYQGELKS